MKKRERKSPAPYVVEEELFFPFEEEETKLSIQPKVQCFTGCGIFPRFFFPTGKQYPQLNISDRNYCLCCPQDVLNTTVATPETDKQKQTRRQKLLKTLIFHLRSGQGSFLLQISHCFLLHLNKSKY